MIYTITLNPSIDYTMRAENFEAGKINRSEEEISSFGGKGLNVSFVLNELGAESRALGFVGGYSGDEIVRLSRRAGIECDMCRIRDDSRINIKIISEKETAINGKGPFIREDEENALLEKLSHLTKEDTVILSGKSPDSESGRLLENVIDAISHTRFVADMEGDALLYAVERGPFLIKPNAKEAAEIFGISEDDEEGLVKAAVRLRDMGAKNVLLSMGECGIILAADDGKIYRMRAPEVEVVSTVGAGDSCLAGFLAGYGKGMSFALALSAASGSAAAASAYLATREKILEIFSEM